MNLRTLLFPLFPLLALVALPAVAADWVLQPGSTLGFEGRAQGEAFLGRFDRFEAQVRFAPDDLAATRFVVEVDLTSASTDNSERDELLQGEDFFASAQQARARFEATRAVARADGGFDLIGTLDLKAHTAPVTLHFRWTASGGEARLEGETELDRTTFGVGLGDWADADTIGHAVTVRTRLLLAARP